MKIKWSYIIQYTKNSILITILIKFYIYNLTNELIQHKNFCIKDKYDFIVKDAKMNLIKVIFLRVR